MNNAKTGKILGISSIVVALLSPLIGLVLGITTLIMARRYELYSLGNKSFKQEKMLGYQSNIFNYLEQMTLLLEDN